jgi:arsenate reductase-like glutaredoxin family protein
MKWTDTKVWDALMERMLMSCKRPCILIRACAKLGSSEARLLKDYVEGLEKGIQKLLLKKDKEIRELRKRIEGLENERANSRY